MTAVTGSFVATGNSASFVPKSDLIKRSANVSVWGTFVGTVTLQRSFDNGANWLPLTNAGATAFSWTAPASEIFSEPESGVLYRLSCTAFTSGPINYRISQ